MVIKKQKNTRKKSIKLIKMNFRRFAIETWYLEKKDFKYGQKGNDLHVIGHYTQMVWATTHFVGCAINECHRFGNNSSRTYFVYVCNYCPM